MPDGDEDKILDYKNLSEEEKERKILLWLSKYAKQIRDEHSRMALEFFKQVILKEDLYHNQNN